MNQKPITSHEAPLHDRQLLPVRVPDLLVGREHDLSSIQPTLKAGTGVLLYGPAGIGKTTLAAALAAEYIDAPGGVIWLEVQQDTLPSLVLRLARALGLTPITSLDEIDQQAQSVQNVLKQTHPLLVLDGDIPVDTVRTLIRTCANGIPLIFMHTRMVAGSWLPYAVEPLSQDAAAILLNHYDHRATSADHPIWEVLGGSPLAIQIVGHQLAANGIDAGQFLANMPKMPPGGANRLMGILMTAYRLLPKDLQGLVLLLGTTFTSGANTDLLAEVSKAPAPIISGKMRELVSHGFAYERTAKDQTVFFMHELVKTFAHTFLRGKKQLDAMQTRHLTSLMTYAQRQISTSPGDVPLMMSAIWSAAMFAAEHDPAALDQLLQTLAPTTPESVVNTHGFQLEYEWLRELRQDPARAELGVLGELETTAEVLPEPVETVPTLAADPVVARAELLDEPLEEPAAEVETVEEVIEEPLEEPVEESAEDAPEVEEPAAEVELVSDVLEPTPVAERVAADAVTGEPTPSVELPADVEMAEKLRQQVETSGEAEQSIEQYAEALEGYKADGNIEDELAAIQALAELNLESDNYEDVLKYLERGTELAQETDNPRREGEMLVILGDLQMQLGRFDGAESAYKEAVSAFKPAGAWLDIGIALDKLAIVYDDTGRWQDAIDIWEQTLPIFEREQRADLLRYVHGQIGDNQTDLMRWNQAKKSYNKALELAEADDDEYGIYAELSRLAWMMETSGQQAEAVPYYQRALHLALKLDDQVEAGETMLALARLLIDDTSQLSRVIQLLETALTYLPGDTDVQRLLNRAHTRQERLTGAGIDLPSVDDSVQDYAQSALEVD